MTDKLQSRGLSESTKLMINSKISRGKRGFVLTNVNGDWDDRGMPEFFLPRRKVSELVRRLRTADVVRVSMVMVCVEKWKPWPLGVYFSLSPDLTLVTKACVDGIFEFLLLLSPIRIQRVIHYH